MIRPIHLAMAACALVSLAAGGQAWNADIANAQISAPSSTNAPAPAQRPSAQLFANKAASGDAFEIATSELALETSKSPSIQSFARQMVTAHTESTTKLKQAASSARPAIVPDPALTPEQESKLAALRSKTGADFDSAYTAEQVAAHQMTLDMLRGYAAGGDVQSLKDFATGLAPIVAGHLDMAKMLKP
jgi:putative membrane protein